MIKLAHELETFAPPALDVPYDKQYGALTTAAAYCGFSTIPGRINGEWQHGHIIRERNIHPEFVVGSDGLARTRSGSRFFVARRDQADYLRSEGFADVVPIGLPIIYEAKPDIERMPETLLVMPGHTLPEDRVELDEVEYTRFVASLKKHFRQVVCCVHKNCFETGRWIASMERIGIPCIRGAFLRDANSLRRMAYLFSRFDVVTSYEFGSHFAYAAYFGARVSWNGPNPVLTKDLSRLKFYKNCPELIGILDHWKENGYLEERYGFLRIDPLSCGQLQSWGREQLGEQNKKRPAELRKLFGWNLFGRISRRADAALKKRGLRIWERQK